MENNNDLLVNLHNDGYILVNLRYPHVRSLYHEVRILAPTLPKMKAFLDAHPSYTRIYREFDGSFTLTSYLDPEKVILPFGPVNIRQLCELIEVQSAETIHLNPAPFGEQNLIPDYQMDGCFAESIITVRGGLGPGHIESDARLIADAIRSSGEREGVTRFYLCYSVEDGKYLYHIGTKRERRTVSDSLLSKALAIRERFAGFCDSLSASRDNESMSIHALLDELCEMLGERA